MPAGIDLFYTICAAAGLLFTVLSAISGRHGRSGAHGHGHSLGRLGRGHGIARLSAKGGARVGGHVKGGHTTARSGSGSRAKGGAVSAPHITVTDFLSPFTIAVFIGAFGLLGLIGRSGLKLSPQASLGFSALSAMLVAMALVYTFVKVFLGSEGSSLVVLEECVGTEAEVLVGINPGRIGSIAYVDKGTRLTLPARADGDQAFGKGERVYICRLDGGTAWVKRDRPSMWDADE